ncbi:MAG: threonine-phosphate decarboxylase [Nitrospiraceae bacterium]|nr:MAG: threonine-phosphate decarboxylase [Nitrospiraceae bacterium]
MRIQGTEKSKDGLCPGSCVQGSDFEHGGNIYEIAGQLGIPENELIDFSASINPLGLSRKVKETIRTGMDGLINYPDPDTSVLRLKLAEHLDIDPATILCGNGSTELIYLIPRALKPVQVLIPAPTFSEYERAVRTQNTEHRTQIKYLEIEKSDDFRIKHDDFIAAIRMLNPSREQRTKNIDGLCSGLWALSSGCMAFLCNPNNPTGALLQRSEILEIAEAARKQRCYLMVDEAFIDFTPEESVIHDVKDNPYLIVLRSMTKFHALTGLRIGYAVFHTDLIRRIQEFKEPWTVNNLAQDAAVTALDDREYIEKTYRMIAREKKYLEKNLKKFGIRFFPSTANYYLLKVADAGELVGRLRNKGILVRDCSNFKGLDNSYVRIAVKSRRHNRLLLNELKDICRIIPTKLVPEGRNRGTGIQKTRTGFRLEDCRNDRGTQ